MSSLNCGHVALCSLEFATSVSPVSVYRRWIEFDSDWCLAQTQRDCITESVLFRRDTVWAFLILFECFHSLLPPQTVQSVRSVQSQDRQFFSLTENTNLSWSDVSKHSVVVHSSVWDRYFCEPFWNMQFVYCRFESILNHTMAFFSYNGYLCVGCEMNPGYENICTVNTDWWFSRVHWSTSQG